MNVSAILKTAALVGTALGIGAMVSSCKKDTPLYPDLPEMPNIDTFDQCCTPHLDKEFIFLKFVSQLPENDSFGKKAFRQWYDDNFVGHYVGECCVEYTPDNLDEWMEQCQNWIDNYLNGTDICDESDDLQQ